MANQTTKRAVTANPEDQARKERIKELEAELSRLRLQELAKSTKMVSLTIYMPEVMYKGIVADAKENEVSQSSIVLDSIYDGLDWNHRNKIPDNVREMFEKFPDPIMRPYDGLL